MATSLKVKNRKELGRIGYSNLYTDTRGKAFFFEAGMAIDADGAYRAYHKDNSLALDYLANGGKTGNWWALVTDTGKPDGKPVVQSLNDPAPGYYISTTSLQDASKARTDARRYVDSESIPFIVLPAAGRFGARLGDLAMVYNPRKELWCGGVFGDGGPAGKIGEASIAMAAALGVPSSPKHGGQAHGLIYWVMPGSSKGWPLTKTELQEAAGAAFELWGGAALLKQLMADYL